VGSLLHWLYNLVRVGRYGEAPEMSRHMALPKDHSGCTAFNSRLSQDPYLDALPRMLVTVKGLAGRQSPASVHHAAHHPHDSTTAWGLPCHITTACYSCQKFLTSEASLSILLAIHVLATLGEDSTIKRAYARL
jgi:hypothetical protein